MKRYCFDTSGFSNPLEAMPRDIHVKLWDDIIDYIASGNVAVTKEVFDEIVYISNGIGDFVSANSEKILLEVGETHWDWNRYIAHNRLAQDSYQSFISEFNKNIKGTIGLTDLSIISLAKTLNIPLVNMESLISEASPSKRRIPNICKYEGVQSLTFNDFLRKEGFKF